MAANANNNANNGNPKIIPLDEGWDNQIKAKVSE
jgi:hypothetical protein